MHYTTTVASALAIVLAVTSTTVLAQEQPGGGFSAACSACLLTAATAVSPTCDATSLISGNAPDAMTPEERACLCPLASDSSSAWVQSCIGPDICVAEEITLYAEMFVSMKDAICAGGGAVPPPPATTAPTATGSSSVATSPGTTTAVPATTSTKPSNTTSATPTPTKPPGKSGAAGSLFGSSNKVVAGATLAIASVAALLL